MAIALALMHAESEPSTLPTAHPRCDPRASSGKYEIANRGDTRVVNVFARRQEGMDEVDSRRHVSTPHRARSLVSLRTARTEGCRLPDRHQTAGTLCSA